MQLPQQLTAIALIASINQNPTAMNTPTQLTLRHGLQRYYHENPDFVQNQDLDLGLVRIPWRDLQRHDIMHVVTGYDTTLEDEMRLVGFILTGLTWRRPWTYYGQNIGAFLAVLWRSCWGRTVGTADMEYGPVAIWRFYCAGMRQGLSIRRPINAYLNPEAVMDQDLDSLRHHYGIRNAGAWD
ncbi:MAG: hypothetical protein ACFBSG_21160 [Leptolyngbyaceae cyanobacterium]